MSRRYEMVLVADPTVPEPAHDEQITRVESAIQELGGTVQKVDRWGRQKLAYSISGHGEGNYTLVLYDGAPDVEKELLRRLRLSDTFMRFLSVRADHERPPTAEEIEALAETRREQLRKAAEREAEAEARASRDESSEKSRETAENADEAAGEGEPEASKTSSSEPAEKAGDSAAPAEPDAKDAAPAEPDAKDAVPAEEDS